MTQHTGEPWRDLIKLVSENISQDCLTEILTVYLHMPEPDLFKLNAQQVQSLYKVLNQLTSLRVLLYSSAQTIITPDVADRVVQHQLDGLAIELIKRADFSLFPHTTNARMD